MGGSRASFVVGWARALALVTLLLLAPDARAVSVGYFSGHFGAFNEGVGYGVADDLESAEAFGVPIVPAGYESSSDAATSGLQEEVTAEIFFFDDFDDTLRILYSNLDGAAGTVTVTYTGLTLEGEPTNTDDRLVYLFFATALSGGLYDTRDVGILVEEILLGTTNGGLEYYYPAVLLENGGVNDTISFDVTVRNGFVDVNGSPVVPDFSFAGAYVVPEPHTAALLALGLAGLGLAGRRYSA